MAGTGTRKMGNAKAPARAVRGQTSTNKRVAVGSKNTTGAKTVRATVTPGMAKKRAAMDKTVLDASRGTGYRNLAREGATKKGGMPVYNSTDANRLRISKTKPRSNMT